jgi:hypothetical protein
MFFFMFCVRGSKSAKVKSLALLTIYVNCPSLESELSAHAANIVEIASVSAGTRDSWILICLIRGHIHLFKLVSANAKAVDASFSLGNYGTWASDFKLRLEVVEARVRRCYK